MSCDMATPHEMKTWRRPTKRSDDSSVRGFDRLVDLRKPTPPTRNFTMLRGMKEKLKELEELKGDVSAQINEGHIRVLSQEIDELEKELIAEAEEDSDDAEDDAP